MRDCPLGSSPVLTMTPEVAIHYVAKSRTLT